MKLVMALSALAVTLALAAGARAERTSTKLTRGKLEDHLYSFKVKVERDKETEAGEFLRFRVTVKPKDGKATRLSRRRGELTVFDGKQFVSSSEVRPTERKGEMSFSFRIAAKYAEKSKFMFGETVDHQAEPGGFYYWFRLKDFAEPSPEPE